MSVFPNEPRRRGSVACASHSIGRLSCRRAACPPGHGRLQFSPYPCLASYFMRAATARILARMFLASLSGRPRIRFRAALGPVVTVAALGEVEADPMSIR